MVKRIVAAVIVVVVLIAGYWAYTRYAGNARLRNGEVTVADSDDNTVHATPSRSDTPGTINTVPVASNTGISPSAASSGANTQSASMSQLQAQSVGSATATAPATDSQAPNAPNGAAFAGSGQYQVYRQGNLTWRINTSDGTTCILFATNEEWRKPVVYSHGCPSS